MPKNNDIDWVAKFRSMELPVAPLQTEMSLQEAQDYLPEEERGFLDNFAESWARGRDDIKADIAVYEAATSGEGIEEVLDYRRKLQYKQQLDPVEGNFLANLVYKSAKILPGWLESSKTGIKGAAVGAVTGAATAAVLGALIPAPEEVLTVPGAAVYGAKKGFMIGSAHFWYKQGTGSMYADMLELGYDPEKSLTVAKIAAVPYALLEFLQIKGLTPSIKKGLQPILKESAAKVMGRLGAKFGKQWAITVGKEISEEVAQEVVQIAATDVAGYLSGADVKYDKEKFFATAKRLGQVAWESAQAFALLPIPGAAVGAATELAYQKAEGEAQAELEEDMVSTPSIGETYEEGLVTGEASTGYDTDVFYTSQDGVQRVTNESIEGMTAQGKMPSDAMGKLFLTLMTAADRYGEMKEVQKGERAERFGEARDIMMSTPNAVEGLKLARKALGGKYTEFNIEPLTQILTSEEIEGIAQEIRSSDKLSTAEAINLGRSFMTLVKDGRLPVPNEVKLFSKEFGDTIGNSFTRVINIIKPTKGKLGDRFYNAISIPKATAASYDVSLTMRQNILTIGTPQIFWKGIVANAKLISSTAKYARQMEREAYTSKWAAKWRPTSMRINQWGEGSEVANRSEAYAGRLPPAESIKPGTSAAKFLGKAFLKGMEASERAFTIAGNIVRVYIFEHVAEKWERNGFMATEKDYEDLGHITNLLTGEGDARALGKFGHILNAAFFAPRLVIGRFQAMFEVFNPKRSWAARKVLAHQLVSFSVMQSLILMSAAKIQGVDVEKDPRATDFLKIRYGDMRIDLLGGYQPIFRMISEIVTGQHKTQTGEIIQKKWGETLATFLQSKLGPVPSASIDFWRQETFYGEKVERTVEGISKQAYNRLTPFIIQDIIEAVRYQGIGAGAVAGVLAFHGVGIQTYEQTPGAELTNYKNTLAMEVFGKKWKEVGPEAQEALRANYPVIDQEEAKMQIDYKSPKFMARLAKQQQESTDRIKKGLYIGVRKELEKYYINVGGVGRRVGKNWYLNDKRYDVYEKTYTKLLNKVLPIIFKQRNWESVPFMDKQKIIADITAKIKASIRNNIIQESNISDLRYLSEGM